MDDICETNINRQVHSLDGTIGALKTEAMKERLLAINPELEVNIVDDFIDADNMVEILSEGFDYIIDCIDSMDAKAAMVNYCSRNKMPILTTGGAGGQIDPSEIKIDDLSRTTFDPLAARLRSQLRYKYGFSRDKKKKFKIPCVYSTEQLLYPQGDGTTSYARPADAGDIKLDCSEGLGATTVVTASFAMQASGYVLRQLAAKANQS